MLLLKPILFILHFLWNDARWTCPSGTSLEIGIIYRDMMAYDNSTSGINRHPDFEMAACFDGWPNSCKNDHPNKNNSGFKEGCDAHENEWDFPQNCIPPDCLHDYCELSMWSQSINGLGQRQVNTMIDIDGTPIYQNNAVLGLFPHNRHSIHSRYFFKSWYHTDSQSNMEVQEKITLTCENDYFRYIDTSFFPLDGKGFNDQLDDFNGISHNYAFTSQVNAEFTYRGDEIFSFIGDDDFWVFINGQLVIDLGGVHLAHCRTIDLTGTGGKITVTPTGGGPYIRYPGTTVPILNEGDECPNSQITSENFTIHLVIGMTYKLRIFHAQRHTHRSNFAIITNMNLKSQTDLNVCREGMSPCSPKATCTNNEGGFICECIEGYVGNGISCQKPCPVYQSGNLTSSLLCLDGEECDMNSNSRCCHNHGGRKQCPQAYPWMCKDLTCSEDHCCKEAQEECLEGILSFDHCPINYYRHSGGVGEWGGICQCPNGAQYEVGDNYDSCGSLACEGGTVVVSCSKDGIQQRSGGMKVTCGGVCDCKSLQNVNMECGTSCKIQASGMSGKSCGAHCGHNGLMCEHEGGKQISCVIKEDWRCVEQSNNTSALICECECASAHTHPPSSSPSPSPSSSPSPSPSSSPISSSISSPIPTPFSIPTLKSSENEVEVGNGVGDGGRKHMISMGIGIVVISLVAISIFFICGLRVYRNYMINRKISSDWQQEMEISLVLRNNHSLNSREVSI